MVHRHGPPTIVLCGEVVTLTPGQTVHAEPGVEHWHGASADSFMVHLAIWEAPADGGP